MFTIKRAISRKRLTSAPLTSYRTKIRIRDVYPEYFKTLKIFRLIKSNYSNSETKENKCNTCCFSSCCNRSNCCPARVTGESNDSITKRLNFERITVHDIVEGRQPFAFIVKVHKYREDSYINRNDEPRQMFPETFLTFSSNPYMYITNYKHISYQINHNLFQHTNIVDSIDYHMYFYIYKRLILNELSNLGIMESSKLGVVNCIGCEMYNVQSPICKMCKLSTNPSITPYQNQNICKCLDSEPPVNIWNYKDLSDIRFNNNYFYVVLEPFSGFEKETNARQVRVEQVVKYALFIRKDHQYHAFKIHGNKSLYIRTGQLKMFKRG